jgi:gliding motility-associated lipoprotein GldH
MILPRTITKLLCIAATAAILALSTTACDPNRVFDTYTTINANGWNYDNVLAFDVNIADNAVPYNIYINIRHKGTYEYNNLYVILKMKKPDGSIEINKVNLRLADKQGNWLGTGTGSLYDTRILLKNHYTFTQKGKYTFTIEQYMRTNQLKNITDAGIRIEKADK